MKFMLMIHGPEVKHDAPLPPEGRKMLEAYMAYTQALKDVGVHVAGDALYPASTGSVVRLRDGKTQVLDGPFADSKEQLGGYYIINVPDLDTALDWAARCPGAAYGAIEVRPIMTMFRDMA